jgi:cyanophycinase
MNFLERVSFASRLAITLVLAITSATAADFQYFRIGNKADAAVPAANGIAMLGGGADLDQAFQWLCAKAPGGDFLVLRARGDDDYNPYVQKLCHLNSTATLIIPDRDAAQNPQVSDTIRHAEILFIAGGDQARYLNFWKDTPVQQAINAHLAAGKPIGGTSAGLAVLGEFVYSAQGDAPDDKDLNSPQTLANPFHPRVTVRRDYLHNPLLVNTLTDSHFAKRDRMGRTLVFLARIMQDGWSQHPREIAIDEKSGVLVEADGKASVVGTGKGAYFLRPTEAPAVCEPNKPLTFANISVFRAPTGAHFDLNQWKGDSGTAYSLSVNAGKITSTQPGGAIY